MTRPGRPLAALAIALVLAACSSRHHGSPTSDFIGVPTPAPGIAISGLQSGELNLTIGAPATVTATLTGYAGAYTFTVENGAIASLSAVNGSASRRRATASASLSTTGSVVITPDSTGSTELSVIAGTASAEIPLVVSAASVATVSVTAKATLSPGTAATIPLTITASTASHVALTGSAPFADPVTLSVADASGATKLSVNGASASSSIAFAAPSDAVALVYSGKSTSTAVVTASGTGVSGGGSIAAQTGVITLSGTTIDTNASTDPNYNQPTVSVAAPGDPATFGAQEPGWTNFGAMLVATFDPTTCGTGSAAVASSSTTTAVLNGSTDAFTVQTLNAGTCKLVLADGLGASATVWISVGSGKI